MRAGPALRGHQPEAAPSHCWEPEARACALAQPPPGCVLGKAPLLGVLGTRRTSLGGSPCGVRVVTVAHSLAPDHTRGPSSHLLISGNAFLSPHPILRTHTVLLPVGSVRCVWHWGPPCSDPSPLGVGSLCACLGEVLVHPAGLAVAWWRLPWPDVQPEVESDADAPPATHAAEQRAAYAQSPARPLFLFIP